MRRLLILALLAGLVASTPPVRAQSYDEAPNKLSLEALTAPPPGGSSGGGYRGARSYGGRRGSFSHRSYGRVYRPVAHGRARTVGLARRYRPIHARVRHRRHRY